MLDFLLWLKGVLFHPLIWLVLFAATSVPQFFIAQRLHHQQVWYAFVPVLKSLQWFQLGRVQTFHLLAFIPLVLISLVPTVGPENLQLIIQSIKAVLGLQIGLYLLFYWFRAARIITVRAGERESHCFWLLIPFVNVLVLARFALKKTFWVEDKKEKSLIDKIINGIAGDHKLTTLKKYAASNGFNKHDFERVADKALTVKNNQLAVVTDEAYWVHFINYGIGALFAVVALWGSITLLSNFSIIFSEPTEAENVMLLQTGNEKSEAVMPVTDEPAPSVKVRNQLPDEFIFVMEVREHEVADNSVVYSGALRKGEAISREAQRFYLLDKNFDLLDSVRIESVSGLFGQFKVRTSMFESPEKVAYMAETKALREQNSLGADGQAEIENESILLITNHDGASISQNRELIVDVRRDRLDKTDILYAYDRNLKVINTAEIVYLLNPQKSSVDRINPTSNVELVLEFEEEYTGEAIFLSPLPALNSIVDYLRLMVS